MNQERTTFDSMIPTLVTPVPVAALVYHESRLKLKNDILMAIASFVVTFMVIYISSKYLRLNSSFLLALLPSLITATASPWVQSVLMKQLDVQDY